MSDNIFADNLDTNQYFLSLPAYVQETIKQAGPNFQSEEDLRRIVDKLTR